MKILVAPSAYKGTIQASCLARAVAEGLNNHDVLMAPMADGGDDTLSCLSLCFPSEFVEAEVLDAIGRPHQAAYLRAGSKAFVELARACGIALLRDLSPMGAHTFGLGQLIKLAVEQGASEVIVTLGGSASTDGGTGALRALGASIRDNLGNDIVGGGMLAAIDSIDLRPLKVYSNIQFLVATDVLSPLLGPEGAAAVFAPQKGATMAQVQALDLGLAHFAARLESSRLAAGVGRQLDISAPGCGAAGGTAFGLSAALGAEIVSGFSYLAGVCGLAEKMNWCDGVVVAEGAIDAQSLAGKATGEILKLARAAGKKVWALPARCLMGGEAFFDRIIETSGESPATLESVRAAAAELGRLIS